MTDGRPPRGERTFAWVFAIGSLVISGSWLLSLVLRQSPLTADEGIAHGRAFSLAIVIGVLGVREVLDLTVMAPWRTPAISQPTPAPWISVGDRLPEHDDFYVILYGPVDPARPFTAINWYTPAHGFSRSVAYWLELPPPPRGRP